MTDRLKKFIKYKGFQVAPSELEDLLVQHLDVTDAADCAVYDDKQATEVLLAYLTSTAAHPNQGIWQHTTHLELRAWVGRQQSHRLQETERRKASPSAVAKIGRQNDPEEGNFSQKVKRDSKPSFEGAPEQPGLRRIRGCHLLLYKHAVAGRHKGIRSYPIITGSVLIR